MFRPTVALIYDFDLTLSPRNMQEYGFIPDIGLTADEFWKECAGFAAKNGMDSVLAYMYIMLKEAGGRMKLSRETLKALGRDIDFFPGVEDWFYRMEEYGAEAGVNIEHYIISSGLCEIIEGSKIGDRFRAVFGASYCYDDEGNAVWPATAVNYTAKTQYLYRINKGILDITNNKDLNAYTPEYMRPVPFSHMIYFGDGYTDVPSMKTVRKKGGYAVAVYSGNDRKIADELLLQDRVDFALPADYSEGGETERVTRMLIKAIAALHDVSTEHKLHVRNARKALEKLPENLPVRSEQRPVETD